MNNITIEQFLQCPFDALADTTNGISTRISIGNGHSAIIISETDYEMLKQALRICTEHPEWTISN